MPDERGQTPISNLCHNFLIRMEVKSGSDPFLTSNITYVAWLAACLITTGVERPQPTVSIELLNGDAG